MSTDPDEIDTRPVMDPVPFPGGQVPCGNCGHPRVEHTYTPDGSCVHRGCCNDDQCRQFIPERDLDLQGAARWFSYWCARPGEEGRAARLLRREYDRRGRALHTVKLARTYSGPSGGSDVRD